MNDSSTKSRKNSHLQEWFTSKERTSKICCSRFYHFKVPGANELSHNAER